MGDDVIGRLFERLDKINERLARVETLLSERERRCNEEHNKIDDLSIRVTALERKGSLFDGARGVVVWLLTMSIALYGAWHK